LEERRIVFGRTICIIPASRVPRELAAFRKQHIHHPGAAVPLHTTIMGDFFDYGDLTEDVLDRLKTLAEEIKPFDYIAQSICEFPPTRAFSTGRVLWLSPSPQGPFEEIAEALCQEFPQFRRDAAYPTYHMTVALDSKGSESDGLAKHFSEEFDSVLPLTLVAEELAIYGENDGKWAPIYAAKFRDCEPLG
jgi:2'-5' RNA ligase